MFHKDGNALPDGDAKPFKDNEVKETIVRDIAHCCPSRRTL